jgi:hypothetical protein
MDTSENRYNGTCRVQVSLYFEYVKLISFLKEYQRGGIAQSSLTVGSLLIPLGTKAGWENDVRKAPMDLTNSKM